jgi:hypothetical protein
MTELQPLGQEAITRLAALKSAKGIYRAAGLLGVAKPTFERALAGLGIHPWTHIRITDAIAARDAAGKTP